MGIHISRVIGVAGCVVSFRVVGSILQSEGDTDFFDRWHGQSEQ